MKLEHNRPQFRLQFLNDKKYKKLLTKGLIAIKMIAIRETTWHLNYQEKSL